MKFEDLIIWQKARVLVKEIYSLFRENKDYKFRDQICSATMSIMNNIAEGYDRNSKLQCKHFFNIALGSASEVKSMLYAGLDLGYITQDQFDDLYDQTHHISMMIVKFMKNM